MKNYIGHAWEEFRSSFWFIPALMAFASATLAFAGVRLDQTLQESQLEGWWVYRGGAEGARAVLGAVAGSMISVAGTVFSITIVSLTLASSQFGPRLLRNFMRDTVNQVVLGVFTSTFLYCLIVLRTVRGTDSDQFVPHLSITLGVLMAMVSLGLLIYFIHHTSISIQVTHLIREVSRELRSTIDRLYPEAPTKDEMDESDEEADLVKSETDAGRAVRSSASGYLHSVDIDELVRIASRRDLVIQLGIRPGQFSQEKGTIGWFRPASDDGEVAKEINRAMHWGVDRVPYQDVECAVSQLVEIALRALSPGINDPFTAINCVDWLGDSLGHLAARSTPTAYHQDDSGRVRVISRPVAFGGVVDAAFNQIRQAARGNAAVTIRLLEVISLLLERDLSDDRRDALLRHAAMIWKGGRDSLPEESDREDLDERYHRLEPARSGNKS